MSDGGSQVTGRAAELRDAFDRVFAEAHPPAPPPSEDLLAIRIASEPYALRLTEIAGLFADRKITPVPGRSSALLGIAGFRGAIVPVYDLPVLLGCRALETARWLAIAAGTPVAFAFAVQEGQLRLPRSAIVSYPIGEDRRRHVREFAHATDLARPIVHLPSVLEAIRRQVSATPDAQEH
jgi:purine-binding chemotaxis protein CheW